VRAAVLKIRDFLNEQNLRPDEIYACELALVEACNNAVQYATDFGRRQAVELDVLCNPAAVEFPIRDHTPRFEWPGHVELPEAAQERGRCLFLIQSLMDEASYLRGRASNCLLLRKNRSANAQPTAAPVPSSLLQLNHQLSESEQVISDMAEELSFCYE